MADIDNTLRAWSAIASNNKPSGATVLGPGLDDNLREIEAVVRRYLASPGSSMASSATVDLSTADGKQIPIWGSATVTGLGTEVSGMEYLLTTTGTQVWKNSSALALPGAADITTAAGDYMLAVSKGAGNWVIPWLTKMQIGVPLGYGGLQVAGGSAQGQVKFPSTQAPSTDANTLDDYEEGSWTPSAGGTSTYTTQNGSYTKIGRLVFVRGQFVINTIGTGQTNRFSGLPFVVAGDTVLPVRHTAGALAIVSVVGLVSSGGSTVVLQSRTAAFAGDAASSLLTNGAEIEVSGCYETT